MTTPESSPAETVPPDPVPTPDEAAAQAAQQAAAEAAAALDTQIRELAAEIAKQTLMTFDPCTLRKGVVASVQNTASPPTLTVTISGDTLEIPGVVYYEHYDPQVSDVVHLIKQGTDLAAIGKVAEQHTETAFTDVTLSAGFTHNGNSNGNLKIRRVWDHGVWRVDLQGGVARSSGTTIATGLDTKYRPTSSSLRTLICGRDAGGGANSVKVDVSSSGTMTMVGGTTTGASVDLGTTGTTTLDENSHQHTGTTSVASPGDSTHSHGNHEHVITAVNAGASEHNHAGAVSTVSHSHATHNHSGTTNMASPGDSTHNHGTHEHGIDTVFHTHGSHNHDQGSHDHDVTDPTWISFNNVSYFL